MLLNKIYGLFFNGTWRQVSFSVTTTVHTKQPTDFYQSASISMIKNLNLSPWVGNLINYPSQKGNNKHELFAFYFMGFL